MTSVVDTSVKHFHSGMAGAPILNGVAGSLLGVLDACLRDGFDLKAVTTLVVAAGVATMSFSGSHSATVDSVVLVAGSDLAALNGEQKITALGIGFVKFATAAANTTATGTITFKMAPAGWLTPFTGTNLRVYKSADVAGTGMLFRVNDTTTTGCLCVGYEQMTDINTGTGPFPTVAQKTNGAWITKSSTANTNKVRWNLFADSRTILLCIAGYSSNTGIDKPGGQLRLIGDLISFRPGGDPYAFVLGLSDTDNYGDAVGLMDTTCRGQYMPRAYHGLGISVDATTKVYIGSGASSGMDNYLGPFPSVVDGGLRLSKRFIYESATNPPRGEAPGVYHVPQSSVGLIFGTNDVISGTGTLSGRRLLGVNTGNNAATFPSTGVGVNFVDITGPWR
jgi:hypothetical protein